MKIYNYEYLAKYTNATIVISVRTDEDEAKAAELAQQEFANAMEIPAESWYVGETWDEEY